MLLSLTDPEYPLDMHALGVALDAADHGDRPQERAIVVASANVSSWRREILDWVTAQHAHVWCVQATHLSKDGATLLRQQAAAKGFASFGGEGSEPNPRPRGGHCVLTAANQHGQALGAFNIEGCGFTGVKIPACRTCCVLLVPVERGGPAARDQCRDSWSPRCRVEGPPQLLGDGRLE